VKHLSSTIKCLAIALAGWCTSAEAATITRYQCKLLDGLVRVLDQDISPRFPALVISCQPVEMEPAEEEVVEVESIGEFSASGDPSDGTSRSVRFIAARRGLARLGIPADLRPIVASAASRHGVDPRLVQAVIQVESAFNAKARSPKGARGLMQLMPATAARFGATAETDLFNPAVNVDLGVRYLRVLSDQFADRLDLVLAAYNAGEGAVMRNGHEVPPFRETRDYVRKVLDLYPGGE
jgi:hypothetical protein